MDPTDRQEVISAPSIVTVSILVRYRVSLSTYLLPQLQLWHLQQPVSVQPVGGMRSEVTSVLRFLSHRDAAEIIGTYQRLDDVELDKTRRIPVSQYRF